jgi:predicted nuclease of predicted toxin-antitoxin system
VLRFLADENFNGRILRALQRLIPDLDVIRAQDTHLTSADDRTLLAWAAEQGRILLTHDVATLIGYAYERVARDQPMPGVIAVRTDSPIGRVIEDLELILLASEPEEPNRRILFVPL